jgi:hypothetical protein
LIISALVILEQLIHAPESGFNKKNIIVVDADGTDSKKYFHKHQLNTRGDHGWFGTWIGEGSGWSRSGFDYNESWKFSNTMLMKNIFLLNIQLLAGRNLIKTFRLIPSIQLL